MEQKMGNLELPIFFMFELLKVASNNSKLIAVLYIKMV